MICPACRRDAPVVMRGIRPTCAMCGAMRSPSEVATAVNVAGQPAKVGGKVSRVAGWVVLIFGALLALFLGGGAQLLFPNSPVGLLLGVPIFLLSSAMALALLLGGKRLSQAGDARAHEVQLEAIRSLAKAKGGELEAVDVGKALGLTTEQADALLTDLAKMPEAHVDLDVDDDGRLRYRFADVAPRVRIAAQDARGDDLRGEKIEGNDEDEGLVAPRRMTR
jgi:hypothetical protein